MPKRLPTTNRPPSVQPHALNRYWSATRGHFYGITAIIPLLIAYEVGTILIDNLTRSPGMRNAADVWVKRLLSTIGVNDALALAIVVLVLWTGALIIEWRRQGHWPTIRFGFLNGMILESAIYGLLLGGVVSWVTMRILGLQELIPLAASTAITAGYSLALVQDSLLVSLVLSLGAGLYEEIVFRLGMLTGLKYVLQPVFGTSTANVVAIVISSFAFSAVHYIGTFGDNFEFVSFLWRFIAGIVLALIYQQRGIGVVCYTHAFYDVQFYLLKAW